MRYSEIKLLVLPLSLVLILVAASYREPSWYVLQILLWLAGAWLFSRTIRAFVWQRREKQLSGTAPPMLLQHVINLLILAATAAGIVQGVFKQPLTGFWATSGVLGIVLGIALRGIIADFFSGIALELDPPFKIGDYVELRMGGDPLIGRVTEVNWRATQIVPRDNTNTVYVPNSLMSSIAVNNVYRPLGQTRFELYISFDPGIPHDRVLRVLMSAVMSTAGISKDFAPEVAASKYNTSGVEYLVRYWLKPETSPTGARDRLMAAVMEQAKRSDLPVAFPREEVVFEPKPAAITDHLAFKTAFLERNAFFRSCLPEERTNIAAHMHTRQYPPGSTIVTMGEAGNSMFLVSEGLLEVSLPNGGGHKPIVGKLLAGDFFGEMAMLTDDPRSATVTTVTEAVLYEIRRQHIHDLVRNRPEIAEGMSHVAAERRLKNQNADSALDTEEPTEEHRNLKAIIWQKMRSLLGWHKDAGSGPPPPQQGGANA